MISILVKTNRKLYSLWFIFHPIDEHNNHLLFVCDPEFKAWNVKEFLKQNELVNIFSQISVHVNTVPDLQGNLLSCRFGPRAGHFSHSPTQPRSSSSTPTAVVWLNRWKLIECSLYKLQQFFFLLWNDGLIFLFQTEHVIYC